MTGTAPGATPPDPLALRRSKGYVRLLVLAALIGIPVAAIAYFFQYAVAHLQTWFFTTVPKSLGFSITPI